MKSLLDRGFKYTKALETDVKKTFARIRREREEAQKQVEANLREIEQKVDERLLRRKLK